MRLLGLFILSTLLLQTNEIKAQNRLSDVTLFGSFTTSSKLFYHPHDSDEYLRSQFFLLNNIISVGVDFRRTLEYTGIQLGLSIEYIKKTEHFSHPISASKIIPIKEGYTVVPIEASGYFFIPFGYEKWKIYMGGGGGVYIGSREYEYANVEAPTVHRKLGFGIHVVSGIQFNLSSLFTLRSELKFRDIHFETTNQFTQPTTGYNGSTIYLNQLPFDSRININGMTLTMGILFPL
ncbi:MAG TPA: hypothetical protein VFF29_02925 [Bacteroidota bacterium]|nr:hypothetical protein [Bacteroidota bacterium]